MDINFESLRLFIKGMMNSRENHAEDEESFQYGLNGRLYARNGKLSFSSIKGTMEIYNNPDVVKYLGFAPFLDELVLLVKYAQQPTKIVEATINKTITGDDITIDFAYGVSNKSLTNELDSNASEKTLTTVTKIAESSEEVLAPIYTSEQSADIDLSEYYTLSGVGVPNYALCDIQDTTTPTYNKTYTDAIIVLKLNDDGSLTPRIPYIGDLNWDINRKICCVTVYENNNYKRVYITDNLNPLRMFNLKDNKLSYRRMEEFDIQQQANLLQAKLLSIDDDGSLIAQRVQYTYRLITDNGQKTPFAPFTDTISIPYNKDNFEYAGGNITEQTNFATTINIPIFSTLFSQVQAVAIEYHADGIPTAIRNLGIKDVVSNVQFRHYGTEPQFSNDLTLEELIKTSITWNYCNDITPINNKLIAGGLRNDPYSLQEKYIEDLLLLRGFDIAGNTHTELINPNPYSMCLIDPTNTQESIYLKKRLYTTFQFFGNATVTFKNTDIPGSEETISFESSSDQYIEYIDQIYDWLSGLTLTNFPNLTITQIDNQILFEPTVPATPTDMSKYVFEVSIPQSIIDFESEWVTTPPTISDINNLVYGAQSHGYNRGTGVRITWREILDPVMEAQPELYDGQDYVMKFYAPTLKKHFVKDEIYRFALVPFKNGNPLFAMVLGDVRVPPAYSEKRYIDNNGNPVINYNYKYRNQSSDNGIMRAHRMEARFEVRLPCDFKNYIDGYQIMCVERDAQNRSVYAQGFVGPLMRLCEWQYPQDSSSGEVHAPECFGKWGLPFGGGPLWSVNGFNVYDDPNKGESWDDIEGEYGHEYATSGDGLQKMFEATKRREVIHRKLLYFDSPDLIEGLVGTDVIKNGSLDIIAKVQTDHTKRLIRSRFPGDEEINGNYYEEGLYDDNNLESEYKASSFSRKIPYSLINMHQDARPYYLNFSIFAEYTDWNGTNDIDKTTKLLTKGELCSPADLGTAFEGSNNALSLFALHAFSSSGWLSGCWYVDNYIDESGKSARRSPGYASLFMRTTDDFWTDAFVGGHMTNPIKTMGHNYYGNFFSVNASPWNVPATESWDGMPVTDVHAIASIRMNNLNSIYGGRSRYAYSQNVFVPLSHMVPVYGAEGDNQAQIFNVQGDWYCTLYLRVKNDDSGEDISPADNQIQMGMSKTGAGRIITNDYRRGTAWVYGVVLETSVEPKLIHDLMPWRIKGAMEISNPLPENMNSAYLKTNNLRVYSPRPFNFKDDPLLTNLLAASEVKLSGDYFDAWTSFLVNEFYELEKVHGIITNLTTFKGQLFAIQEGQTNLVRVEEKGIITTNEGQNIAISQGTGETFTDHEKISSYGTSIRRALSKGDLGFSFIDERKKTFVKFDTPISLEKEIEHNLQELFENDKIIDTEGYYDHQFKETNIRIRTRSGKALVLSYNEVDNVFNGYYEYDNDLYAMFNERVFAPIRKIETTTRNQANMTSSSTIGLKENEEFIYEVTGDTVIDSFAIAGLPSGVNFNQDLGILYGKIASAGTYPITVSLTNDDGTNNEVITITVTSDLPVITSTSIPSTPAGSDFSFQITATNDPIAYDVDSLPTGLSVDIDTGLITGTAPSAGVYSITLYAQNTVGSGSHSLNLTTT